MEFEALGRFILDNADSILDRWRSGVRADPSQPAHRVGLSGRDLDDHLPSLLQMLGNGLLGTAPDQVEREGAEHGHQRRVHGYRVAEVLAEMSVFRRALLTSVEVDFQATAHRLADEPHARARLNLFDLLDRSVHASVSRFMEEAEVERDEARAQVADTTARLQEANAQLKDAHVQKDRFLSVLSHELRNPLSPILNAVGVVQRLAPDDPRTRVQHAIIERQTRHLSRLVDDLLDVNRIAYGKLELRPEVVSLKEAVLLAVEGSYAAFEEKGVTLEIDLADETIAVFADQTRISQVVMNLLANAVKFTPDGGSVAISLHVDKSEAVLRVQDTGAGIPAEVLPRIFEAFEQADTSLAHSEGGLGLGLMVARGLVEAQGGRIDAHSDGPNQGAEFIVRMPLSLSEPAPAPSISPAAPAEKPRRIVLIDDHEDAREALATALRLLGHEVFVGANAEEALQIAYKETPDTFILDIGLPGTNGYDLAKALRADGAATGAKLIALTGYGAERDRARARDARVRPSPDKARRRRPRDSPAARLSGAFGAGADKLGP